MEFPEFYALEIEATSLHICVGAFLDFGFSVPSTKTSFYMLAKIQERSGSRYQLFLKQIAKLWCCFIETEKKVMTVLSKAVVTTVLARWCDEDGRSGGKICAIKSDVYCPNVQNSTGEKFTELPS